jgi:hypothetical protein
VPTASTGLGARLGRRSRRPRCGGVSGIELAGQSRHGAAYPLLDPTSSCTRGDGSAPPSLNHADRTGDCRGEPCDVHQAPEKDARIRDVGQLADELARHGGGDDRSEAQHERHDKPKEWRPPPWAEGNNRRGDEQRDRTRVGRLQRRTSGDLEQHPGGRENQACDVQAGRIGQF